MRVRPNLSRPLDLSPSEVEAIVDHLAARLEGWVVPRLYGSFRASVEIRLNAALADLEAERADVLTAALALELPTPPVTDDHEDEDAEQLGDLLPFDLDRKKRRGAEVITTRGAE